LSGCVHGQFSLQIFHVVYPRVGSTPEQMLSVQNQMPLYHQKPKLDGHWSNSLMTCMVIRHFRQPMVWIHFMRSHPEYWLMFYCVLFWCVAPVLQHCGCVRGQLAACSIAKSLSFVFAYCLFHYSFRFVSVAKASIVMRLSFAWLLWSILLLMFVLVQSSSVDPFFCWVVLSDLFATGLSCLLPFCCHLLEDLVMFFSLFKQRCCLLQCESSVSTEVSDCDRLWRVPCSSMYMFRVLLLVCLFCGYVFCLTSLSCFTQSVASPMISTAERDRSPICYGCVLQQRCHRHMACRCQFSRTSFCLCVSHSIFLQSDFRHECRWWIFITCSSRYLQSF
jgi:hypothetical protein